MTVNCLLFTLGLGSGGAAIRDPLTCVARPGHGTFEAVTVTVSFNLRFPAAALLHTLTKSAVRYWYREQNTIYIFREREYSSEKLITVTVIGR